MVGIQKAYISQTIKMGKTLTILVQYQKEIRKKPVKVVNTQKINTVMTIAASVVEIGLIDMKNRKMSRRALQLSFLLGIIFQEVLRILRRCHKFSRNLHDAFLWDGRSIHQNIDILGVKNFPKNFGIVHSLIFQNGRSIRIIFQKFFPKTFRCQIIFQKIFQEIFQEISGLKKIIETSIKIYLKSKQKNLYIYLYVLRIRIYIHIYNPKSKKVEVRVSVLTRGAVPAAQERTAERIRTIATASIHIYKRQLQRNSVTPSHLRRSYTISIHIRISIYIRI